jgi:hypothetical protein
MKRWTALALLTAAMLGLSIWLTGPAPRKIVFATGQEGGGDDTFGKQYKVRRGKVGLGSRLLRAASPSRGPLSGSKVC